MEQKIKKIEMVKIYEDVRADSFIHEIQPLRHPAVLKNVDIGPCMEKWTAEFLMKNTKDKDVKIHVSTNPKLDFLRKNFLYKSIKLDELICRIFTTKKSDYFIDENEYYYLRSLGANVRKDVADIRTDFPQLANDVKIPDFFTPENFFSSVFRIGSAGTQLWTHYDIMDNMLIQIHGTKKVVLFSPEDTSYLYLVGDKSSVIDIENPDLGEFPQFNSATKFECLLGPGDILFIPALWFHNVTSIDPSVAVNVFWRHLGVDFYDKKDTYGNKDVLPAAHALQLLEKATKNLSVLPDEYQNFYLQRMICMLQEKMNVASESKQIKQRHNS